MAHRTQDEVIDTLENLLEDVMNKCEYSRLNLNNQEQILNVHNCGPTGSASISEETPSRSLALMPYISREDWLSRLSLQTTMVPTTNCRTNLSTPARIVRQLRSLPSDVPEHICSFLIAEMNPQKMKTTLAPQLRPTW